MNWMRRLQTTITLDASKSYNPGEDRLTFKWWMQPEAGTYAKEITLSNESTSAVIIRGRVIRAGKLFM